MSSHPVEILSLRPDVSLVQREDECAVIGPRMGISLGPLPGGVRAALGVFAGEGDSESALFDIAESADGLFGVPQLSYVLDQLAAKGLVRRTLCHEGRKLVTLVVNAADAAPLEAAIDPEAGYILSRHALLRSEGGQMIAESPLSLYKLLFHDDQLVAHCAAMHRTRTGRELSAMLRDLPTDVGARFLQLLRVAEILRPVDSDAKSEVDPARQWEFHDLYFHSKSRLGRHSDAYGGTYRFLGVVEPLPALKPPMSDDVEPLLVPDLDRLAREDAPFTKILEKRRSLRAHSEAPITRAELGEFLYRAARQRRVIPTDHGELSDRPYPGGGAIYELEVYPVIDRCQDLPSGLYHYRPGSHELSRVSARTPEVEWLLEQAGLTMARQDRPQVMLVVTARFPRVSWKYQSMAYALVLKDVGVLYQTFYLVGTAMGLATCALGGGDSVLFARASGLDWLTEGAVGEFVLGRSAEPEGVPG